MADVPEGRNRHFILKHITETEAYRYPGGRGDRSVVPEQDRVRHAGRLQRQIAELKTKMDSVLDAQQDAGMEDGLGLQVDFESLARERSGVELLNVRHGEKELHRKGVISEAGALGWIVLSALPSRRSITRQSGGYCQWSLILR